MKQLLLVLPLALGGCGAWARPQEGASQIPDTAAPLVPRSRSVLGWACRCHAGNNAAWARPDFDASAWDTITLNQPLRLMPRATQAGVYWRRRRFRLADSLRQRGLVLQLHRLGTADVYLNGRLLTDSTHRTRVRGLMRVPELLELPANGPAEQVLAVCFVPWHPSPLLLGASRLWPIRMLLVAGAQQQQAVVAKEDAAMLKEAQTAGDAAEVAALADDLSQNLGKITEHGRRAAAIVKGMLAHSRTSTGERAPTDVNQLADEYLRLACQGLRAKDKAFSAKLETDFAPALPPAEAAGADLGRVLLNLLGNAFYAMQQRQRAGETGYAPTVLVRTRRVGAQVEICVADNGTGIPDEAKTKIFQPFFTTKPTGQGLSLSYYIITKGHGGTLAVASQEGQGTTFTILLPA